MYKHASWIVAIAACSTTPAPPAQAPAVAVHRSLRVAHPDRFDTKVRQDFFDGIRGDQAALDRAMKLCADRLAANPNDAEAMVWQGAGVMFSSGQKFRAGDQATGVTLYTQGLAEMDKAVALAPSDIGVRIPRGAVLLGMAPFVPEPERAKLLERGVSDYETTLDVQKAYFATLDLHSREQLLYGLVDGYANLGNTGKARAFYDRMSADAAGSELLARAKLRADGKAVEGQAPCEQCHAR
jgi:pentatricopeptide repeat protein